VVLHLGRHRLRRHQLGLRPWAVVLDRIPQSTRTRRGSSKSGGAVGPNSLLELPILFGAWTGSADDGAVIAGQLNTLAVAAVALNVKVTVDTGYANLDGQLVYNGASRTINLAAANATNPRIDRIILERTRTAGDTEGKIVLKVSTGTAAASPAAPALTNDATTLQYSLAQVRVNALSTSVTSVTDERTYALTSVSRNPTLETVARAILRRGADHHRRPASRPWPTPRR
jgi:hypothetical protein